MTVANVRSAARNVYEGKRSNLAGTRPDELRLLDRIYRKVVIGQSSYFFLLEGALAGNPKIMELYTAKLIHRTSATWLEPDSFKSYVYYMVDYGTSIELLRKAGAKAWDDLAHNAIGHTAAEFFPPTASSGLLDLVMEKLVASFAKASFEAQPADLVVDEELIEGEQN